ncbi:tryptophan--tRNA ligase [Halomarina oriensis]|uniref:Tryptophan--tRNA ligase n=1 Tax=Halomarina oriensis TaxID=671145 RepID=A0A6B0GLC8_9EURY|nr:tryptophan--tRNA ligase [Halomarina oriensis]MWG34691.1 tryptophan--tRNA ligase [Halomarina oriensis]
MHDDTNTTDARPTDQSADPSTTEPPDEYDRLVGEFGADPLTDDQRDRFPDAPPLIRRGRAYAGRDLDRFLAAAEAGERVSVVTGVGPSGPMHLGHVVAFSLARYLQASFDAHVLVPLSDDEKYCTREQTLAETRAYTRENLRDVLGFGFDPDLTTVVVDTADADVLYPLATALAKDVTPATYEAVYGAAENVGASFYPAMQAAHLLLPQFVDGPHPTTVPIAVDQDPHVRLARDLAAKERFPVTKPGALLAKFLPALSGPGKMNSSDDAPRIDLTADRETVREVLMEHAYSGGRDSLDAHREHGGDPAVDVAFQYLRAVFEPDDSVLGRLDREYRSGELLTGELKDHAVDRIATFLEAHQSRRPSDDALDDALEPYRLTDAERERALAAVGLGPGVRPV